MPKSFTATLAGKQYVVTQASIKASSDWRKRFKQPLELVLGVIRDMGSLKLDRVSDLLPLVQALSTVLLDYMDIVADMVFSYSPVLEKDRERIVEQGFDDELVAVLLEVIKLAFPFDQMLQFLRL